jgi:hypothetical protein
VERRKKRFVLSTEEEWVRHRAEHGTPVAIRMSGADLWDALRPPPDQQSDHDFPRHRSEPEPMRLSSLNAEPEAVVEISGAALWDALRLPPESRLDFDLERPRWNPRGIDL